MKYSPIFLLLEMVFKNENTNSYNFRSPVWEISSDNASPYMQKDDTVDMQWRQDQGSKDPRVSSTDQTAVGQGCACLCVPSLCSCVRLIPLCSGRGGVELVEQHSGHHEGCAVTTSFSVWGIYSTG
jgi:hypothetical protein